MTCGTLYIVATPIGNLGDISLRALEVLKSVDCIAAEDTRMTRKLLSHYKLSTPLVSYHDHVEHTKAQNLVEQLQEGKDIALVSDSGMPLICDPGYNLVQKALAAQIELVCIPGPSALVNALVLSGLAVDRFVFEGYLSRKPSKRRKEIRLLIDEKRTIIFYESPHRLLKALHDVLAILGNRRIAVMRELTKKFEEQFHGSVEEAIAHFTKTGVRGEFVVVLSGQHTD
ncbi:MAG: 16S rRNA (cytidine(1402)-2'-O)-methyltransferase [Candidatus Omnitrophica bacterium]|nr:16S rRNA (cytidine(1402)-2'-O)-methyltransferase [Candidatus Omnitrophota bacterium]